MAKLALNHGADVNAAHNRSVKSTEPDRNSALMWASLKGKTEIVTFLLENSADPLYSNTGGYALEPEMPGWL
jgi:ankyrin repeat protein